MDLEHYKYQKAHSFKEYEFYSEGPRGRIRKKVLFQLFSLDGLLCYNLSFGDWNEERGKIDDRVVTNNGDAEKVFVTVALIVIDFTLLYPEFAIHIRGVNEARTRRYQMGINKMWNEIKEMFDVYGDTGEEWEPFRKNVPYKTFLIKRVENLILQDSNDYYMPSSTKNSNKKKAPQKPRFKFVVIDHSDDPFCIKKMEMARETFERIGLPKELMKKR